MKHLSTLALALSMIAAPAAATTIDFESTTAGDQPNPLTIGAATFTSPGGLYVSDFFLGHSLQICSYSGGACDQPLNLAFSAPVNGLTFTYDGVDSTASTLSVLLTFGGGGTQLFNFTPLSAGSMIDLSAYANIAAATVSTNDNLGLAFDNFTYNIPGVPEPATWAMMLLGFGGIGVAMRRKRRSETLAAA